MSKGKRQAGTVGFLSFFKLNLVYGLALGQLAGIGCLVMALSGFHVYINLGVLNMDGIPAGIMFFVLLPPVSGIAALVTAPVVFVPFSFATRLVGGIKVS